MARTAHPTACLHRGVNRGVRPRLSNSFTGIRVASFAAERIKERLLRIRHLTFKIAGIPNLKLEAVGA